MSVGVMPGTASTGEPEGMAGVGEEIGAAGRETQAKMAHHRVDKQMRNRGEITCTLSFAVGAEVACTRGLRSASGSLIYDVTC